MASVCYLGQAKAWEMSPTSTNPGDSAVVPGGCPLPPLKRMPHGSITHVPHVAPPGPTCLRAHRLLPNAWLMPGAAALLETLAGPCPGCQ